MRRFVNTRLRRSTWVLAPTLLWLLLFGATPQPAAWAEGEFPWPTGQSTQDIHGRKVILSLPADLAKQKQASLVVILHGAGGSAEGMAGALRAWPAEGYVVCAPKSEGQTWAAADIVRVLQIAATLKAKLPIDPKRVHVVGFSNGGWNLAPLAFDDDLHPCSATWVAAGYNGGRIPAWAPKGLGTLALAGSLDGNLRSARQTVASLHEKVRSVEVREQAGLGHKWPEALMPYFLWWMGAMEGRFVPGVDKNFDWGTSIPDALKALENQKKGGVFVYVYDKSDTLDPLAKQLQNETFVDLAVRHYGNQLQAVKLEQGEAAEWLATQKIKLKSLPAVIVLKKDGKLKKVLQGKIKASKLASALRRVAPDRSKPLD